MTSQSVLQGDGFTELIKQWSGLLHAHYLLGVSDELSQPGEIERIEAISELIDKTCGLAD